MRELIVLFFWLVSMSSFAQSGSITPAKTTSGEDGVFATFNLNDPDFNQNLITSGGSTTGTPIVKPPGAYTFFESQSFGWKLVHIDITGETVTNSSFDINNRRVDIILEDGENILVTFINDTLPSILSPTYPSSITDCLMIGETNNDNFETGTANSPIFELDTFEMSCPSDYSLQTPLTPLSYSVAYAQDLQNDPNYSDSLNTFICSTSWDGSDMHSTSNVTDNNHNWLFTVNFGPNATDVNLDGFYIESGITGEYNGANSFIPMGIYSLEVHVWINGVHDMEFNSPTLLGQYEYTIMGRDPINTLWSQEFFDFGSTYQNIDLSNSEVVIEIYGYVSPNPAHSNPSPVGNIDIFLDDMLMFGTEEASNGICGCSSDPCTPEEYSVCSNNSNTAFLTAESGLMNYRWFEYDENTMMKTQLIGTGQVLEIQASDIGSTGDKKCYIYEAEDGDGCLAELCCPICVGVEDCCSSGNCYGVNVNIRVRQ